VGIHGGLRDAGGHPIEPSYYQNGQLRVIDTLTDDGWVPLTRPDFPSTGPYDDLARMTGIVVAYDPDGDSSRLSFALGQSPQHGHAWVNQTFLASSFWGGDHTLLPGSFVPMEGAWVYAAHKGDPYVGADPFTVRVTDAEGASTLAFVLTEHMRGVGPKSRNCDATAWAMSDDDTAANSRLALNAFTSERCTPRRRGSTSDTDALQFTADGAAHAHANHRAAHPPAQPMEQHGAIECGTARRRHP
jgi:hypothetical protein